MNLIFFHVSFDSVIFSCIHAIANEIDREAFGISNNGRLMLFCLLNFVKFFLEG